MRRALPFLACGLVALVPLVLWGSEGAPAETAIPISTGAGGLGVGAISVWMMMHGRLKAAETSLASIGPQLPALLLRVEQLVTGLETMSKAMREDGVANRGKIHDLRGSLAKHEGRIIRLEERFNGLRDAVEAGGSGLPRAITDDVTGPIVDTGKHRSVPR